MKARYLSHKTIDKKAWDEVISQGVGGNIYGASWYLDAVWPGWNALVADDYKLMAVVPGRRKFMLPVVLNPFFIRQCGVYAANHEVMQEIPRFLQSYRKGFLVGKIHLQYPETVAPLNGAVTRRMFQQLDISTPDFEQAYSSNHKRNLKTASKHALELAVVCPGTVVEIFKRNKGGELGVFHAPDFNRLYASFEACVSHGAGEGFAAVSKEGDILATGFFSFFNQTITYLQGSTTPQGKDTGAMHFLMHQVASRYAGTFRVLDFGGSSVPSVARFYNAFGGTDRYYYLWEFGLRIKKS